VHLKTPSAATGAIVLKPSRSQRPGRNRARPCFCFVRSCQRARSRCWSSFPNAESRTCRSHRSGLVLMGRSKRARRATRGFPLGRNAGGRSYGERRPLRTSTESEVRPGERLCITPSKQARAKLSALGRELSVATAPRIPASDSSLLGRSRSHTLCRPAPTAFPRAFVAFPHLGAFHCSRQTRASPDTLTGASQLQTLTEGGRFELPRRGSPACRFSRPVHSTALPPFHANPKASRFASRRSEMAQATSSGRARRRTP
jgi:hypothetical protein